jgi:hypothetical protein
MAPCRRGSSVRALKRITRLPAGRTTVLPGRGGDGCRSRARRTEAPWQILCPLSVARRQRCNHS